MTWTRYPPVTGAVVMVATPTPSRRELAGEVAREMAGAVAKVRQVALDLGGRGLPGGPLSRVGQALEVNEDNLVRFAREQRLTLGPVRPR